MEFTRGRTSTQDELCPGCPMEATTPEAVSELHGIVVEHNRVYVHEIAEALGISVERVHNIFHETLQVQKLHAW